MNQAAATSPPSRIGMKLVFYFLFACLAADMALRTAHVDLDFKVFYGAAFKLTHGRHDFYPGSGAPLGTFTYKYSPFFPMLVSPLGWMSEPSARLAWGVLNSFLFAVAWLASESFLAQLGIALCWPNRLLTLVLVADPLTQNAIQGNTNLLLLCLMAVGLALSVDQKKIGRVLWGALFTSIAVAIKLTPGALLVYFLVSRRWRSLFIAAFLSFLWLIVLPALVYSPAATAEMYARWLSVLRDTSHFPFLKYTNQSVVAVLTRMGATAGVTLAVWGIVNAAVAASIAYFAARKDEAGMASASLLLILTLPSIVWQEYYMVLLVPYLIVNQALLERRLLRAGTAIWVTRLILVNGLVQALVGRSASIWVNTWGNCLWGTLLLLPLLFLDGLKRPATP